MLGEPHQVEAELVDHLDLLHGLGVDVGQCHRGTRRTTEVVDDTEAEGLSHGAAP